VTESSREINFGNLGHFGLQKREKRTRAIPQVPSRSKLVSQGQDSGKSDRIFSLPELIMGAVLGEGTELSP
jgi:hypothetical protein